MGRNQSDRLSREFRDLAQEIIAVYSAHHTMTKDAKAALTRRVQRSLLDEASASEAADPDAPDPEFITCLECSGQFRSLRRHLTERHQTTAQQYCAKWNLPREYQLVAPNFSQRRSEAARRMGLGRRKP